MALLLAAVAELAAQERDQAVTPLDSARRVAAALADTGAALRGGYRRIAPRSLTDLNPLVGEHWINERYNRSTVLDVAHPAYLMYYPLPGREGPTLVGVGYTVAQPAASPPPTALFGPGDRWHVHLPCADVPGLRGILVENVEDCREFGGAPGTWQIAMVHVWVEAVPHPDGEFAQFNTALPYLAVGIAPPSVAELADAEHARWWRELGLALGETFGAVPRMGTRIAQRPDSSFAHRVRGAREEIRALRGPLRAAREAGDAAEFQALAAMAIGAWRAIRDAYLDGALSPQHKTILERWFAAAVAGHHGTQLN